METIIGACRFCGQIANTTKDFLTQAEADEWATENCECISAARERNTVKQIENAKYRVEELFGEECEKYGFVPVTEPDTLELLEKLVEKTARGRISAATVQMKNYGKAGIALTSKGKICVTRSHTKAYKLEE